MSKTIQQTIEFEGVTPEELFEIYVDAKKHAAAIGAPVTMSRRLDVEFSAFGSGFVRGRNLHIVDQRQIVQTWRAQAWKESDPDSILILAFEKSPGGARIELLQASVPDHAFRTISDGWTKMYWDPWRAYIREQKG
jgi:activator of HSP90 ATPase